MLERGGGGGAVSLVWASRGEADRAEREGGVREPAADVGVVWQ